MTDCSIPGCTSVSRKRGWCEKHYRRWSRTGDPMKVRVREYPTPEEVFLSNAREEGGCLVWTKSVDANGYGRLWYRGKVGYSHRYAWERVYGEIPPGKVIDHICHTRSCVDVDHLRLATYSQNNMHRSVPQRNNLSGFRNVHWERSTNKWFVRVTKDGREYTSPHFNTPEEANKEAVKMRTEIFKEFAGK